MLRELIEGLRIVDQQSLTVGGVGRDRKHRIDQNPVIGDMSMVGVRPVSAPETALRKPFDQMACERGAMWVGRLSKRQQSIDAIDATDLDMKAARFEQGAELTYIGLINSQSGINPSHMIDHHRHLRLQQRRAEVMDTGACEMYLQVQASLG